MVTDWGPLFRRRVIQPGFFRSFLLQCIVPPTCLCIAAVSDSRSDQLLRTLHPNTSVPALYAHFLLLLQSAQSVPSSRFLAQTLFRGIIRCTKTSGFASYRLFSSTTQWVYNVAHNFMLKFSSFQMSSDGCQHGRTRVHTGRDAGSVFVWVMSKNPRHFSPSTRKASCASFAQRQVPTPTSGLHHLHLM